MCHEHRAIHRNRGAVWVSWPPVFVLCVSTCRFFSCLLSSLSYRGWDIRMAWGSGLLIGHQVICTAHQIKWQILWQTEMSWKTGYSKPQSISMQFISQLKYYGWILPFSRYSSVVQMASGKGHNKMVGSTTGILKLACYFMHTIFI